MIFSLRIGVGQPESSWLELYAVDYGTSKQHARDEEKILTNNF